MVNRSVIVVVKQDLEGAFIRRINEQKALQVPFTGQMCAKNYSRFYIYEEASRITKIKIEIWRDEKLLCVKWDEKEEGLKDFNQFQQFFRMEDVISISLEGIELALR